MPEPKNGRDWWILILVFAAAILLLKLLRF